MNSQTQDEGPDGMDAKDLPDHALPTDIPLGGSHTVLKHELGNTTPKLPSSSPIIGSPWKLNTPPRPLPSFSELLKLEAEDSDGVSEHLPISDFQDISMDYVDQSEVDKLSGFYYERINAAATNTSPGNSPCSTPVQSSAHDDRIPIHTGQASTFSNESLSSMHNIMIGPDDQSSSSLKKHYSGLSSTFLRHGASFAYNDSAAKSWKPTPQWKQKRLKRIRFVYANFRLVISANSTAIQKYSSGVSTSSLLKIDPKKQHFPLFFKYPDVFPLWTDVLAVVQRFSPRDKEQHDTGKTGAGAFWPCCSICLAEWADKNDTNQHNLTCPRSTPCGHTFCYPCLVHYFMEGGTKWRPCPVCFEYFCLDEIKPLLIYSTNEEPAGDLPIAFIEMRHVAGTILTVPASEYRQGDNHASGWAPIVSSSDATLFERYPFSKYFIAMPEWCLDSIYKPELGHLLGILHQSVQEDDWSMVPFYEICISNIEKFISGDYNLYKDPLGREDATVKKSPGSPIAPISNVHDLYTICNSDEMEEQKEGEAFYQSSDGRFIFLAPSSIHKLEESDAESLKILQQKLLDSGEFEEVVMTGERRKRYAKYFGHIPLGARFVVLYI